MRSSASPKAAASTWCSIPSAARFSRTASAASPGGARLLVIGFTGGIGLARTNLLLIKGASVLGVRAGEAMRRDPAAGTVRIAKLLEWAGAGKIRPHISHRLPLQEFARAMRLLIDRKAIGRVALTMG